MLAKLKNDILDLMFPARCLNCGKLGRFVCEECLSRIVRIKRQSCPFCHSESEEGRSCLPCRRTHRLWGVMAFGFFHDPILKQVIHRYKYEGISAAGGELAKMLAPLVREADVLTFVPVSRRRRNERGYNQAEILAAELSSLLCVPIYKGLKKIKQTKRQVGLKRKERLANLEGAFVATDTETVAAKRVLIIDDVLTTGATLEACARILRAAGAKRVRGLVLARE